MSPDQPAIVANVKARYRSGSDHLGRDFFEPLLHHATSYDRAAGYFSSGALNAWAAAVPGMAARGAKIRLLIAAELNPEDHATLRRAIDLSAEALHMAEDEISHRLVDAATNIEANDPTRRWRAELLAWLIASGLLELKFAWFVAAGGRELYHEKFGVITLEGGARVSFNGSANETTGGHETNLERIEVFRSWMPGEESRIDSAEEDFGIAWQGLGGVEVSQLSEATLRLVKERAPSSRPCQDPPTPTFEEPNKWRHQEEAVEAFLKAGRGVLEMATGTGKTRTALKIMSRLQAEGRVDSVIVCTNGNDLLAQWHEEILGWCGDRDWACSRYYGRHHDGSAFSLFPEDTVLICSRRNLPGIVKAMSVPEKRRTLVVHDEVHGLGEPSSQERLRGEHAPFAYTLGLSATPSREYDETATEFIFSEVGPVIFEFGLKDAIERGILVEFDYEVIEYDLTEEDRDRIKQVYSRKAARAREGNPMSDKELWIEIARVYKTAEEKRIRLEEFLVQRPESLNRCIIFVETKEYAQPLYESLHQSRRSFSQYFDSDEARVLQRFAEGDLDCLVTCHKLSQGIDIPDLRTVILVSSSRAMLETIQRLGRCLRSDPANPKKRALVIDFCRSDAGAPDGANPTSDAVRVDWLRGLSATRLQS